MSLMEHLAELRHRLIVSMAVVTVATIFAYFFYDQVIHFIDRPYRQFALQHPSKSITPDLVVTGPLEGFATRLKVSGYLGLFLASPVLLWELWRFITPGLHKNEKRYAIPFIASAVALFALGVTTSILVFPKALSFLISVSGKDVAPLFGPQKYVNLYVAAAAIFGTVFLFPVVLVFLMISGAVPSRKWRKWRRTAIVVMVVVAAVVTPSNDPYSFLAMAVPMLIFYELAIILGRILKK
jgi:sec-independent protein translocase protein TatC